MQFNKSIYPFMLIYLIAIFFLFLNIYKCIHEGNKNESYLIFHFNLIFFSISLINLDLNDIFISDLIMPKT
jgi:hypothetical protein